MGVDSQKVSEKQLRRGVGMMNDGWCDAVKLNSLESIKSDMILNGLTRTLGPMSDDSSRAAEDSASLLHLLARRIPWDILVL